MFNRNGLNLFIQIEIIEIAIVSLFIFYWMTIYFYLF